MFERLAYASLRFAALLLLALTVACGPGAPTPAAPTAPVAKPTEAPAPAATTAPAAATTAPAAAAATTAPAKPAAAAPAKGGQIVYSVVGTDVRILNTILQSDTVSGAITERVFDPLVNTDPKTGAIIPELAESWEISPDAQTYTFKIRSGVKFHDGHALTSDDVKFTYDVLKTDRVKTQRTSSVEKVKSVDAVDPQTLRISLTEAYCPFLNDLTQLGILPKHLLENSKDLNEDPFNLKPVGSGAFKFVEWVKDDHVTLQANDDYWGGRPSIDRFILRPLKDRAAQIAQLKTGEVDVAVIDATEVKDLEPTHAITRYFPLGLTYLAYNTRQPGLDDMHVRQALNYALDRKLIIDQVLLGEGRPMASDVPPDSWAYNPNTKQYDFSPDKAKQMLDAAGWTVGAGGIRAKGGQPLKYTIWTNSGAKVREAVVTIAQQQFKDVGVDMEIQLQDFASMINRINKLEFDMFVSGFVFGADPDNYDLWHSSRKPDPATGKEGFNRSGFSTPELDALIEKARTVPGCAQAARKDLYTQIQDKVSEGAGWNFLFQERSIVASNKKVAGIDPSPFRRLLYNVHKWTVQS
ncbi:MAG TPA: peptide-binding protein [Chloroflexota bacterium]